MHRQAMLALLLAAAVSCTHAPATEPVWVRINADGTYRVNDVVTGLDSLDAMVLAQAIVANPSLSDDEARTNVMIYLSAEPTAPYRSISDALVGLRRFENLGIVGEDRR